MLVRLPPSDMPPAGRVGCLLVLAAILLLLGAGLVAVFVIAPAGRGDPWVMPVVGTGFALVGALLLVAGVRGARGLKVPEPEVFIDDDVAPVPGAVLRLRLCQRGPMTVDSLQLRVSCERRYERQVRPNSTATVEDGELLWEQVLDEVRGERIAAGSVLERDAVLRLPADARPTGPTSPDGTVRWRIEVRGDAGFMRATYRAFDIQVAPVGGAVPAAVEAAAARTRDEAAVSTAGNAMRTGHGAAARSRRAGRKARAGLMVIGLGFIFPAAFFLWAFFSGVASAGRGNPYMALVGGLLFGTVGLVLFALGVLSMLPGPKAAPQGRQ